MSWHLRLRFYEDFLADAPGAKLPHMHLRVFAQNMFARCALLKPLKGYYEMLFATFREYKCKIPVCGCILLDESMTKVVLVRNWQKTSWGLPKGKLNQNESKPACAAREVLEETGLDVGKGLDERSAIELMNDAQATTMFVVTGVPLDFPFAPQVRKEISKIAFFPLDDLPSDQRNVDKFLVKLKRMLKTRKKHVAVYGQKSTTSVEAKEQDEDEEYEPVEDKRSLVADLFPPSDYSNVTFGPSFVVDEVELARVIRDAANYTYSRQFGTETHRLLRATPRASSQVGSSS